MNFSIIFPELTALAVVVFLLVREIFLGKKPESNSTPWLFATGGTFLTLASLFPLYGKIASSFGGSYILDSFSLFFKTLFTVVLIIVIFMSREFFKGRKEKSQEFLLVLLSSLLGLFFLSSAQDFVLLFVALETFTLSLYVLAAYLKKDFVSIESGLKYLIMGSLASAFVIYGFSLIFTATGSASFLVLRNALSADPSNPLLLLGIILVLCGLGFKIAAVPFQLWAPDVYEGAPAPVAAYLSVASKSAGILILLRFLFMAVPDFDQKRTVLFSALAALTLTYGNLGALLQTNVKRLFGYSSISHAGYLLIALAAGTEFGVSSILYYLLGYAVSNLAAFWVITLVEKSAGNSKIESFRGLGKRSPFLAGIFFLSLLSLAGVPPLAGFFGKFLIFMTAVQNNLNGLTILGALFVAVSLYYYLNLVRVMYFDASSDETAIAVPSSAKSILLILAAGIVIIGLFQAPLYSAALSASKSLF